MVKIMENPIKMDDLGVPAFSETSICLRWPAVSFRMVDSLGCYQENPRDQLNETNIHMLISSPYLPISRIMIKSFSIPGFFHKPVIN